MEGKNRFDGCVKKDVCPDICLIFQDFLRGMVKNNAGFNKQFIFLVSEWGRLYFVNGCNRMEIFSFLHVIHNEYSFYSVLSPADSENILVYDSMIDAWNSCVKVEGRTKVDKHMLKLNSLQALRAIAFLGIFIWHCGIDIGNTGAWGVSVFFVLSGFLMIYNYMPKGTEDFEKLRLVKWNIYDSVCFSIRKILKLWPVHLLMLILLVILSAHGLLNETFDIMIWIKWSGNLLLDIFLLQSWVPIESVYYSFNGVAWFLSVSVFLYSIFPLILKRISVYQKVVDGIYAILLILIIQVIVAWMTTYISVDISKWVTYICPLYRAGDFIIGCNLGYIFLKKQNAIQSGKIWTLAEVFVIGIVLLQFLAAIKLEEHNVIWLRYTLVFTLGSMGLVYLFAINQGFVSKFLTNKLLLYIGNISGEAFLIHQIIIGQVVGRTHKFLGYNPTMLYIFIVSFAITIFMVYIIDVCRLKWHVLRRIG